MRPPIRRTGEITPSFDDGQALHATMCERGLEGTVAKHTEGLYKPGARDWIKVKNPAYWRLPRERAAMQRRLASKHANSARSGTWDQ